MPRFPAIAHISGILACTALACGNAETRDVREVAPGVRYTRIEQRAIPNVIHVLEVDLAAAEVSGVMAGERLQETQTLQEILSKASDPGIVAAINGDFFTPEGTPSGAQLVNGEMVKEAPESWYALGFTADHRAFIEQVRFSGAFSPDGKAWMPLAGFNRNRLENEIILYNSYFGRSTGTNTYGREVALKKRNVRAVVGDTLHTLVLNSFTAGNSSLSDSVVVLSAHGESKTAILSKLVPGQRVDLVMSATPHYARLRSIIGGYPLLVKNKKSMVDGSLLNRDFATSKNARTAVGLIGTGRIVCVCVDGKLANYSAGMSLVELADWMISLGCETALNLDGGGSTAMVVAGALVNRPSDGGLARPIANALVIRKRP